MNILIFSGKILFDFLCKNFNTYRIKDNIFLYNIWAKKKINFDFNNKLPVKINLVEFDKNNSFEYFLHEKDINLVIIFNPDLCRKGLTNFLIKTNIPTIGITSKFMPLENSKLFGKEFMNKHNIPTSEYKVIRDISTLKKFIKEFGFPFVIKRNEPYRGFGTYILHSEKECIKTAKEIFKKNSFFIAEKYIKGEELTLHTIWDGKNLIPLKGVKDYKRLRNNDEGINTGSMGSYTPTKITPKQQQLLEEYVKNLERVFREIKPDFKGIFASDLIFTEANVYNLEFNMRLCEPEFEVLIEHLNCDLLNILYKTAFSDLKKVDITYKKGVTGAVNIVHKDFEKNPNKNIMKKIKLPPKFINHKSNITVGSFITDNKTYLTNYYLFTIAKNDLINPFPDIYKYVNTLKDKNLYYRTDLGSNIQ